MSRILNILRAYLWAALLVLSYAVLAVAVSMINPIHEATDELRHYRYVRYLADYGQLPVQSEGEGNAQAHHPPLYYATAALVSWWVHPGDPLYEPLHNPQWGYRNWEVSADNKNLYLHGPDEAWPYRDNALAAHLARWMTVLWGTGAVLLTLAAAHVIFPDRPGIAVAAGALIAFNPMFLYLGGAVNNDVPAGLAGAAITYACVRMIRDGYSRRFAVLLGILYGLAILVKFNLVAMLAVIELALVLALFASRDDIGSAIRTFLAANGIIAGITLLVAGWWYIRNTILYGEPTGFLRLTEIWGFRDPGAGVQLAGRELHYAWTSLWARFSYGQIPVPDIFYIITASLSLMGLTGLALLLIRAVRTSAYSQARGRLLTRQQWHMLAILMASALINFAVLYAYITVSPAGAMGRFFFPGLPAFVVLVAAGLVGLLPRIGQWAVASAITVGMILYALAALLGYLRPAYAIPPAQAAIPATTVDIRFGDYARILAYEVTPETARAGDALDVTVTWEVLRPTEVPYAVFIHIISETGAMVAQRDTYTGLGNYPSQWWQPGHVFTETYRIYLPNTTYAPDEAIVHLGLYHPEAGRLPVGSDGSAQTAELGTLVVQAEPDAEYPNEVFINWDHAFALVGYTIEPRTLYPGQKIQFTLYWQALNPPAEPNYMVFLHIMEGWERKWGGADGNPVWAEGATSEWVPSEVYEDIRTIRLPPDIPPGIYTVELGWFAPTDGHRLNIIADDGHIIDNWLALNTIRVIEAP